MDERETNLTACSISKNWGKTGASPPYNRIAFTKEMRETKE